MVILSAPSSRPTSTGWPRDGGDKGLVVVVLLSVPSSRPILTGWTRDGGDKGVAVLVTLSTTLPLRPRPLGTRGIGYEG